MSNAPHVFKDEEPSAENDVDIVFSDISDYHRINQERFKNRIKTTVSGPDNIPVQVSTVALIGYTDDLDDPPMYETCLFYSDGGSAAVERCASFAERRAMHTKWCDRVKQKGRNCAMAEQSSPIITFSEMHQPPPGGI